MGSSVASQLSSSSVLLGSSPSGLDYLVVNVPTSSGLMSAVPLHRDIGKLSCPPFVQWGWNISQPLKYPFYYEIFFQVSQSRLATNKLTDR